MAGYSGPAGATGAAGPQGAVGPTGAQGASAGNGGWSSYRDYTFNVNSDDILRSDGNKAREIADYTNRNPSSRVAITCPAISMFKKTISEHSFSE